MKIGITGATGFIGRYIVNHLTSLGHELVCWYRSEPLAMPGNGSHPITWIRGSLRDSNAVSELVDQTECIVHAALFRPGNTFRGGEGDLVHFVDQNITGSIELMSRASQAGCKRFVFISTGAVHERILSDRKLDETHPTWALSHYGAHKAAIEQFVYSFGLGQKMPICTLRPTGVYGVAEPVTESKWFDLVRRVITDEKVSVSRGGKEVHAADVARAVALLLTADGVSGQSYECYDRYISEYDVASIARELSGSRCEISGPQVLPANQIDTSKIQALGMTFGGMTRLRETIEAIVHTIRKN